jgi:hypothetical protein
MSNDESSTEMPLFGGTVYTYTRAQAIADGVLVEVTDTAREAGFQRSVAMTDGAWNDCVAWSADDNAAQVYQDEAGRLWDVLTMAMFAIRCQRAPVQVLNFELLRVPRDGHTTQAVLTTLKLMIGPGDDGLPVLTILLPFED